MNRRLGGFCSSPREHLHTTALSRFAAATFGSATYPSLVGALQGTVRKLIGRQGILFLLCVSLTVFPLAGFAFTITDDSTGGDCSSIGVWDVATKTCTLTQDLSEAVAISGNDITLDGAGHSISTTGPNTLLGILVNGVNVTTLRNLAVSGFETNIHVFASNDVVIENIHSERAFARGANVDASNRVTFTRNTFAHNPIGVAFTGGSDTLAFTQNNFLDNADDMQKDAGSAGISLFRPLPEGGNYWSFYDTPAEGCNDVNTDGFCDAPYSLSGAAATDQFPWTTENGWVAPRGADLALSITDTPDPVVVGQNLTYRLTIHNNGPDVATNAAVSITLPDNVTSVTTPPNCTGTPLVCTIGSIASGTDSSVDVVVRPTVTGDVTVAADVLADQSDSVSANNTNIQATTTVEEVQKVVLLLHGMNSSPDEAWSTFARDFFSSSCAHISGGQLAPVPIPNRHGSLCYAVKFGEFDLNGPPGLEGIRAIANEPSSGDFTTFDNLGVEVRKAVLGIQQRHISVKIVLVGHSRGGLAARAFLQSRDTASAAAKSSIIGLITTGTPHVGTPLARIYEYLESHPRPTIRNPIRNREDWEVVDFLNRTRTCHDKLVPKRLDVRRPTIKYLATGSNQISRLVTGSRHLPQAVKYGQIRYTNLDLGILARILAKKGGVDFLFEYSIFHRVAGPDIEDICDQVSRNAERHILRQRTASDHTGDGIVPVTSQQFGAASVDTLVSEGIVTHMEETEQNIDFVRTFCALGFSQWLTICGAP